MAWRGLGYGRRGGVGFGFDAQPGRFDDLPLSERVDTEGSIRGFGRRVGRCR